MPALNGDYTPNFNLYLLTAEDDIEEALLAVAANFGKLDGLLAATWRSDYDPAKNYGTDDVVTFNGETYITVAPVIGVVPPAAPWQHITLPLFMNVDGGDFSSIPVDMGVDGGSF